MDGNLIDLRDCIKYTQDELRNAIKSVEDISLLCDGQWQEIEQLRRRLAYLDKLLDVIVPKAVSDAIQGAIEEYDRQSDLADAASY